MPASGGRLSGPPVKRSTRTRCIGMSSTCTRPAGDRVAVIRSAQSATSAVSPRKATVTLSVVSDSGNHARYVRSRRPARSTSAMNAATDCAGTTASGAATLLQRRGSPDAAVCISRSESPSATAL